MMALAGLLLAVSGTTLSLPDALARADRAAGVALARAQAEVRHREVDVVRAPAPPVVTLGTTRYSAREEISVTQDVRFGGERRYAVASASGRADAADAAARRSLVEARWAVRQAWYELAAAEDGERLAHETVVRVRELVDSVRARFEGGRAPRLDLVRASAEAARLSAAAEAAGETRRASWAHLAALVGLDPGGDGATDGSRPDPLDAAALSALRAPVHEHPALVAAEDAVNAAVAAREAASRRRLPGLAVSAGVNADDPGLPGPDWQGSVSLTVPIGGDRGRPALRVAEAEQRLQEAELEAVRRELGEARETAYRRLRGAAAQLRALDAEALPAAEEAARLTREAYEFGRGDIFRLLESERALLQTRGARLTAYRELKLAEADLLEAVGENDETR